MRRHARVAPIASPCVPSRRPELSSLSNGVSAATAGPSCSSLSSPFSQRFARRRTILVIGHRLATVRQADRVVVLEDGRITEIGAAASLLRRGNRCHDLFASQLGRAV